MPAAQPANAVDQRAWGAEAGYGTPADPGSVQQGPRTATQARPSASRAAPAIDSYIKLPPQTQTYPCPHKWRTNVLKSLMAVAIHRHQEPASAGQKQPNTLARYLECSGQQPTQLHHCAGKRKLAGEHVPAVMHIEWHGCHVAHTRPLAADTRLAQVNERVTVAPRNKWTRKLAENNSMHKASVWMGPARMDHLGPAAPSAQLSALVRPGTRIPVQDANDTHKATPSDTVSFVKL